VGAWKEAALASFSTRTINYKKKKVGTADLWLGYEPVIFSIKVTEITAWYSNNAKTP
jgi:hypothetical protein